MRLFTAIDIPADVRDRLADLVNQLRPLAKIRWSPVTNLHITTKFIGEWPEEKLDSLKRALSKVEGRPVDVAIRGLGWFPNLKRPRVFWAGVDGGDALRELALATENGVAKIGVPSEEREYSPHLTLARIDRDKPVSPRELDPLLRAIADQGDANFGSFRAESFYLYLSAGGRYTRLADFSL